jgi:hypothetical protein
MEETADVRMRNSRFEWSYVDKVLYEQIFKALMTGIK